MKQSGQDKGTLLLALIAGLSINGTFAAPTPAMYWY